MSLVLATQQRVKGNAVAENKSQRDPIPEHFADMEAAAEFWDNHDLADYEDMTRVIAAFATVK